ncbi:hypothetical protein [Qipengyuania sediminis]|uniref:hypothetical protein n=1 Tax=Qipengyuania sediminis TaxID=1532023 RepID=UPI00105AA38B|nr:hypothetical protein [Qipengyuania sediminis]
MSAERIDSLFTRIEAALARIEAAATALPPPSGGWNLYRKLRDDVRGTVQELDTLIAELET